MRSYFVRLLLSFMTFLSVGCATSGLNEGSTSTFVYGQFELAIPTETLAGAKVFKGGDVAVKFADASLLAPVMITHLSEELPESFDLRLLPEAYLFGALPEELDPELTQALIRTGDALMLEFQSASPQSWENNELEALYVCSAMSCTTFVESRNISDQILMIVTENIDPLAIRDYVKER